MLRTIQLLTAATLLILAPTAPCQTVHPKGTTVFKYDACSSPTLITPLSGGIVLLDMMGTEAHRWVLPGGPTARVQLARPLPNGRILSMDGNQGVVELDWDSNVVWSWSLPAAYDDVHHDISRLPNGNTLVLSRQAVTIPAISQHPLRDDCILEVDPAGNIVWTWETWRHFAEFNFDPITTWLIAEAGGDWAHTNAVEALPPNSHTAPAFREGNLIVSQRHTNRVFIIDRATGSIVWTAAEETWGQHNAHMIPPGLPGEGNILLFDNGSGTPYRFDSRDYSRVIEIDPETNTVVWEYNAGKSKLLKRLFWSSIVSGAQRLMNGNTLICSGVKGRLFEVTPDGTIVWEYMSPYHALFRRTQQQTWQLYRATRIPPLVR